MKDTKNAHRNYVSNGRMHTEMKISVLLYIKNNYELESTEDEALVVYIFISHTVWASDE